MIVVSNEMIIMLMNSIPLKYIIPNIKLWEKIYSGETCGNYLLSLRPTFRAVRATKALFPPVVD